MMIRTRVSQMGFFQLKITNPAPVRKQKLLKIKASKIVA
jgi:hypothetical protein